MSKENQKYDPNEAGFRSWSNGDIEFRPKHIYYFTKHFFLFLFFLMTSFACIYVHDKYAKLIIALISIILMTFLLWSYISIMVCTKWTITDQAIIIKKGVLIKTINQTELFRVIDFSEKQNIIQNIFNNTNLYIYSSDKTDPELCLYGITRDVQSFLEIKRRVQEQRQLHHIHETNINANNL